MPCAGPWIPASAGMTGEGGRRCASPVPCAGPWIPAYAGMTGGWVAVGHAMRPCHWTAGAVDSRFRGNDGRASVRLAHATRRAVDSRLRGNDGGGWPSVRLRHAMRRAVDSRLRGNDGGVGGRRRASRVPCAAVIRRRGQPQGLPLRGLWPWPAPSAGAVIPAHAPHPSFPRRRESTAPLAPAVVAAQAGNPYHAPDIRRHWTEGGRPNGCQ